ncbi:hypothetical protein BN59_02082 [Legionella massiliensis]|uniref:Uncharacterized protein n=1 Tax=Legionella massiliensis TaxID=1034943 RepID=A0A078KXN8_9GAMM|nr:hypothetical protein [Legionella massiliensis]CDZ77792.1 hypothetical protein BN59_02082 [Legionella massiliensis]CEE13530.1 hypothetical protein BN1094_02082 [Legionella massiliensis]
MNCFKSIALVILLSVVSGCATMYEAPKANEPMSIVRVKNERTGLATWMHSQVDAIDNKTAGLKLFSGNVRIHPGVHTLTVLTEFNKGFLSSGPYQAFSDVQANFKAGETYTIQASTSGAQVLVWITDSAGRKVSPVSSTGYRIAPKNTVIVMH